MRAKEGSALPPPERGRRARQRRSAGGRSARRALCRRRRPAPARARGVGAPQDRGAQPQARRRRRRSAGAGFAGAGASVSHEQRLRAERWLVWVRLGAVPFAAFQIAITGSFPPGRAAWAWSTVGVLGIGAVLFYWL